MQQHKPEWVCVSEEDHTDFLCETREAYLGHVQTFHPEDSEAELKAKVTHANGTDSIFQSCPLCRWDVEKPNTERTGQKDYDKENSVRVTMVEHLAHHLLQVTLKSLPGYKEEAEELGETESLKRESARLRPRGRSTVELDHPGGPRSPIEFDDPPIRQSNSRASTHSSPYQAFGGLRGYLETFPNGMLGRPNENCEEEKLEGKKERPNDTEKAQEVIRFSLPSTTFSGDLEDGDPSADFVEDELFRGVPDIERRDFEWGFIRKTDVSARDLENDPILRNFGQLRRVRMWMREQFKEGLKLSLPTNATTRPRRIKVAVLDTGCDLAIISVVRVARTRQEMQEAASTERIADAIRWVGDPAKGADIVNMPLSTNFKSSKIHLAMTEASKQRKRGFLVLAAARIADYSSKVPPTSDYDNVIFVTGADHEEDPPDLSSTGAEEDNSHALSPRTSRSSWDWKSATIDSAAATTILAATAALFMQATSTSEGKETKTEVSRRGDLQQLFTKIGTETHTGAWLVKPRDLLKDLNLATTSPVRLSALVKGRVEELPDNQSPRRSSSDQAFFDIDLM
ncbi:pfs domain-containing protein [Colletotrichum kahawae]|uniref:Pfs domain-containing protein n=1 Tax=Colletotrichum kahawae TaxID=34407 RepID=A0AAD9YUN7_COLKA|nr:pfs domain-containing protein [Colletotrichum kahawae]